MSKRIIISIPLELLDLVDQYRITHHYNRSELIRHALRLLVTPQNDKKAISNTNESISK